eukprot:15150901-Ditylum_brightwellii.AAC.1
MDLVKQFSDDIRISFGNDKCGVLTLRDGKVSPTMMLEEIPCLDSYKEYKYLGILESSDFLTETVKDETVKEYLSRVQKILKANLTEHNAITAICAFIVPVMRYMFGVLKWNKGELQRLDRKMRKLLTAKGFHQPNADVHPLYLHWNLGGRDLTHLEDTHANECTSLAQYI